MDTARPSTNAERRWLLLSHVLFGVTLGVPTITTLVAGGPDRVAIVALVAAFAAWYVALFAARPRWHERRGVMIVYAVGALALFTALNAYDPAFFIVLYSLLPQFFSTLPRALAVLATIGIVVLPAAARGELGALLNDADALFGLLATVGLGLVVTAVIEALGRQAEEQQETIAQLEAARGEIEQLLAAARRDLHEREALARTGHALLAARTPDDVVTALTRDLADHSTGVRGAALLSTRAADDRAQVVAWVAGTASPRRGATVPLPARPGAGADGDVVVIPADDVANGVLPATTGIVTVALLSIARGTGVGTIDDDASPETATGPAPDVLWLSLSARSLTPGMQRDLSTVATQTALTLANLRLAARAAERGRTAGVLAERQRLAHEIHDTLAQGFISIVTQLEAADQALHGDPATAATHLDRARRTARDSLGEARRTVAALRPRPLDHGSLPDALRQMADGWAATTDGAVEVGVSVDGAPVVDAPAVDAALLRVAQEALNNIGRHAHASSVTITLTYLDDLVLLDVQDDGRGFAATNGQPPPDDVSRGGYGLTAMRERMAGVGGDLVVESAPGDGTTIAARAPLPAADDGGGRHADAGAGALGRTDR